MKLPSLIPLVLVASALGSGPASAHPGAGGTSYGANPIISASGSVSSSVGSKDLFTAPSDQDIVLRDVHISGEGIVVLNTSGGATIGAFVATVEKAPWRPAIPVTHAFRGGMVVPAGETVTISTVTEHTFKYTIGGEYVQP